MTIFWEEHCPLDACPLCGVHIQYMGRVGNVSWFGFAQHIAYKHALAPGGFGRNPDGTWPYCPCGFSLPEETYGVVQALIDHLRGVGDLEVHLKLAMIARVGE